MEQPDLKELPGHQGWQERMELLDLKELLDQQERQE
jgi:hypothetical protein